MRPALSKYTRENFSRVGFLAPSVRPLFREFLVRIAMAGIYVRIPDDGFYRTPELQSRLFHANPPTTWVLCPHSFHCHGLALDVVPLARIGTLLYRALWGAEDWERRQYETIATIGAQLGLSWGYALWNKDMPHFHWDGGLGLKTPPMMPDGKLVPDLPAPEFEPMPHTREVDAALRRLGIVI